MSSASTGELHLIFGPMFSGKTTKLIEIAQQNTNKILVNYAGDTRYHPTLLCTHSGLTTPCIQTDRLSTLLDTVDLSLIEAVFINEAQFFPDLIEIVKTLVETYGKRVYVAGLDGDFQRNTFGFAHQLISLCDTVEKLHARCSRCDLPALFSKRTTDNTEQILIGSSAEYTPLCRGCYLLDMSVPTSM